MKKERIGKLKIFLIVLSAFAVVIIGILVDSNVRLVTTKYTLYYSNDPGAYNYLPDAFDGYRIVLLADLHGAEHGTDNERLVKRVKDAKPDIITIAGDLIDRYQPGRPVEQQFATAQTLVEQLVKIAPVYYVTGNHEWDSGKVRELLAMLEESGVNVLRNKYVRLASTGTDNVILAGIDDPGGPADMIKPFDFIEGIYKNENPDFLITLVHRNNRLNDISGAGGDLVLSAHAHGGMVRLPFTDGLIGPSMEMFPNYTGGVYTERNTGAKMVVTRGLGNHLGWTRFLNNPQVVVVELKVKQ